MMDPGQVAAASLLVTASTAAAQSDPSVFGTVYNIGNVPPGSVFDFPDAASGTQVGDGDSSTGDALLTPEFFGGDILGSDSQLNLFPGGDILRNFSAGPTNGTGVNVEVNVFGGFVDRFFFARSGSTINVFGGSVGNNFRASGGSKVNISGGIVEGGFDANSGSIVNISGGVVGDFFEAQNGSVVNISGGSLGESFDANFGSTVNISGGLIGDGLEAKNGSMVNISGNSFLLDGDELTGLMPGRAFTINARDVTLSGTLEDGRPFAFDLNSEFVATDEDLFDEGAVLTVTVPFPPLAADFNSDGVVDLFDLIDFLTAFDAAP